MESLAQRFISMLGSLCISIERESNFANESHSAVFKYVEVVTNRTTRFGPDWYKFLGGTGDNNRADF